MKTSVLKAALLFCIAGAMCSCGFEEFPENILSKSGIPVELQKDFYQRFGYDSEVTYASCDGNRSDIDFIDPAGHNGKIIYQDGAWQMTTRAYTRNQFLDLPDPVRETFLKMSDGLEGPIARFKDRDGIMEFSRRGIEDTYYVIQFYTELGPNHLGTHAAVIDEDGNLIEHILHDYNSLAWTVGFDPLLAFIRDRYQGCDVRALVCDGSTDVFFISHDGIRKRVEFREAYQPYQSPDDWAGTSWLIERSAVPEYVWDEFKDRCEADMCWGYYEPTEFYYKETPQENLFGLSGPVSETTTVTSWFADRSL